jgi:tetratricopeptide (TPR) repeat protein
MAVAALVIIAGSALAQDRQDDQRRVALVIGVGAYQHADPLPNPTNDSREIANALRRLRFEVIEVTDPTIADLRSAQEAFVAALPGADVAVLFYAGHSLQVDGANYFLPIDATMRSPDSLESEAFAAAPLVNRIDQLAKLKIIILDACRNNPFAQTLQAAFAAGERSRIVALGLSTIDYEERSSGNAALDTYGTVVAYAAAPGRTAGDGIGDHSPYTKALLATLETPGMELGTIFRQVAASVMRETGGQQKPEYLVKLSNDFYFLRPEPNDCDLLAADEYNQVGIPGVDIDELDWNEAIPACKAAHEAEPGNPRIIHNLARAYDASSDYHRAVSYYREAVALDYVPSINNLGVMYLNGQGVIQDFERGTQLLKRARERGNQYARITMQTTDFSVLFGPDEFRELQRVLAEWDSSLSELDGTFGEQTRDVLATYQLEHDLQRKGVTLETLDALELVNIIPAYQLN